MHNTNPLLTQKIALRTWAKERRVTHPVTAAIKDALLAQVRALPEWRMARNVLLYLAMPGEVNVDALAGDNADGRAFYAPRCEANRRLDVYPYRAEDTPLLPGPFGIREPDPEVAGPAVAPELLDLVVVPALLLTQFGDRLGYGGGYYDRFLARVAPHCHRVGVLPESQIVPVLPRDDWDQKLSVIVTERRVLRP